MKPYRLQLVQALRLADKGKRMEFCAAMLNMEMMMKTPFHV
jgi:hypothetical protein